MGGKLFGLGRVPRAQYLEIEKKVQAYLQQKMPLAYRIPRYYGAKADFGDMDIIISAELAGKDWQVLKGEITADLGISQFKSVSHLFSTVYQNLQVDFFNVPAAYLESYYNYMSFNDLGNLIGRICKKFNLKYGEQGLLYVYRREEGNYHIDLPITTDFRRICDFLGLAYDIWEKGFDTLEQVFEWVIASPYFSVEPYIESKPIEKRAKQRPTIERFLAYLEEKKIDKVHTFEADKKNYLPQIMAFFAESNLASQIAEEEAKEARTASIQSKFNGKHLMTLLPDLIGRELGLFIIDFKALFQDNQTFEEYIINAPQETIDDKIRAFYQQRSQKL